MVVDVSDSPVVSCVAVEVLVSRGFVKDQGREALLWWDVEA